MALQFLTLTDFKGTIRTQDLDKVIDEDPEVLETGESWAKAQVELYISTRFDTDAIFAETGTARNNQIIGWMVDLAWSRVQKRISPRNMSETVQEAYDLAIEQLTSVNDNKLTPFGLPHKLDEDGEEIDYTVINTRTEQAPTRFY
jgi:hypothetical protein